MPITYDQAVAKLHEWTDSAALRCHARAVEAAMRLASQRYAPGGDETQWAITGLLHDADYDRWPEEHPRLIIAWLLEQGEPAIAQAVVGPFQPGGHPGVDDSRQRTPRLRRARRLCHGLLYGSPRRYPLARAVLRQEKAQRQELCRQGEPQRCVSGGRAVGRNLDEHIQLVIDALKPHAESLGITGSTRQS